MSLIRCFGPCSMYIHVYYCLSFKLVLCIGLYTLSSRRGLRMGYRITKCVPEQCIARLRLTVMHSQGRIQDFLLGGTNPRWRGHQPPTQVLFGENICKNERIWSCWGGTCRELWYVDPPLIVIGHEVNIVISVNIRRCQHQTVFLQEVLCAQMILHLHM